MLSIVQNFICTKKERLEVIERNSVKLGEVFKDVQFYINYNSDINFENVKNSYSKNIPKLNLYNNLTKDWALITLSLLKEVKTPYTLYVCEDMEVNCSYSDMWSCLNEFMHNHYDLCHLSKIGKYIQQQFIDGYTPYNEIKSPGYKELYNGYFYLGKHSPHKRVPIDAIFKTEWLRERLEEFLVHGEDCKHDIPFRKRHLPNFWEGYYDFNNGMRRFGDMKCYIPKQVIFKEFNNVKDKD